MESDRSLLLVVRALTSVIDAGDAFANGRSIRIARWTVRIARELGRGDAELEVLEMAARLHDLGRTAILRDVVSSPRALDESERALVRTHPAIGWEMLRDIPALHEVAEIVHCHHEQPDGKGYPRGLQGEAIPLGARIIMVCAAYDAMTEHRPYRRGLSAEAACEELMRHVDTQFFPEVVEAFISLLATNRLWEEFTPDELEAFGQQAARAA